MPRKKKKKGLRRPVRAINTSPQGWLFDTPPAGSSEQERHKTGFVDPDPNRLMLPNFSEHLKSTGHEWVLDFREMLQGLDWEEFTDRYSLKGRQPYAPWVMVGLVLYGTMRGVTSLRALERLAQMDVGAMWLTGGALPDHTSLCRFLNLHRETLTDSFFEQLTREVIRRTGSQSQVAAGDGTVLESAASRFRVLRLEAVEEEAKQARAAAAASPEDIQLVEQAERAEEVAEKARERARIRKRNGVKAEATRISPTDPDSTVLKSKRGTIAPGYVPSIVANEDRIILAQTVDSSSEIGVVGNMIDQAERTTTNELETLLLDANYHKRPVIQQAVEREIDLLCPAPSQTPNSRKSKYFRKEEFRYKAEEDVYICPAGKVLSRRGEARDNRRSETYVTYRADSTICRKCPLRSQCTKNRRGRRIHRYPNEDNKDLLRQIMTKPSARKRFRLRQAMVEPVFAETRHIQGLSRFRRVGCAGVRLEWSLHSTAHNLRRWLNLTGMGMRAALRRSSHLLPSLVRILTVLAGQFRRYQSIAPPNSACRSSLPAMTSTGSALA